MKEIKLTLSEFNQIKAARGNINSFLESKGFDTEREWSRGVEKGTGDYIFMQAEEKIEELVEEPQKPKEFKKKGKK